MRVDHGRWDLRDYLAQLGKDTPVAVEASGGWYWFMDELEAAGKRLALSVAIGRLPEETRRATLHEWELLDAVEKHIGELETRIRSSIGCIGWVRLLKSLPSVGEILGATIHLEIGDVKRFPTAAHLASYAGLVPTVHASGGKSHHGPSSKQSNHYLRWAFVEAAGCILMHRHRYAGQHALALYDRIKAKKCHGKAAVAVARHLAESSWWILRKAEKYRQPHAAVVSSSEKRVSAEGSLAQ